MRLDASPFYCISSNNSGSLYCTVHRMNDCKEGMLLLRSLDYVIGHMIDRMHRLFGLPKSANQVWFSFYYLLSE